MITHCCHDISTRLGGGVETYVENLLNYSSDHVSGQILTSLESVNQNQFALLHVHTQKLLSQLKGECPAIYTVHNHSPYCPSGTKYLTAQGTHCSREMSVLNCVYGHLIDYCGSRRPHVFLKRLQTSFQEISLIKTLKIPVLASSQFMRNQLLQNAVPDEQIILLPLGIASASSSAKPLTTSVHNHQRILFVGRIVPDKGLQYLLEALTLSPEKIQLDIAGDGWQKPRLQTLAQELGISDRVTWHGWCQREQLNALYEQCFCVIFPSVWPEPAGLVTLEAYTQFRAVIASSTGGIPDYLRDMETGLLVPPGNVNALANAITTLSAEFQACQTMGEAGHTLFLSEFTFEKHIQQLHEIYQRVMAKFK